jgi:cyclophilin family peptidyl-prolyl cis-trans isomerase
MAASGSGKNPTSTSQFFIVLASSDDQKSLDKIKGKYVVFGNIKEGDEESARVLSGLNGEDVACVEGDKSEKPRKRVWIGGCGVC